MYAQPVENAPGSPVPATVPQPSRRTLAWARLRELGEAIMAGGDPARIVEQARELVDILGGREEWKRDAGWMRPVPMVALNDHQVALMYIAGPAGA